MDVLKAARRAHCLDATDSYNGEKRVNLFKCLVLTHYVTILSLPYKANHPSELPPWFNLNTRDSVSDFV